MALSFAAEAATVLIDELAVQELAQFEPDPDGMGASDTIPEAEAEAGSDDPWIVWLDATRESAWATMRLMIDWPAAASRARNLTRR